jgi:hypothetical protein
VRVECPAAVRVRDIRTHLSEDSPFIVSKTVQNNSCRQLSSVDVSAAGTEPWTLHALQRCSPPRNARRLDPSLGDGEWSASETVKGGHTQKRLSKSGEPHKRTARPTPTVITTNLTLTVPARTHTTSSPCTAPASSSRSPAYRSEPNARDVRLKICFVPSARDRVGLIVINKSTHHGIRSPISPDPSQSAPTRSLEKIGSLFCMCTLSMAHIRSCGSFGTDASKYLSVSSSCAIDV